MKKKNLFFSSDCKQKPNIQIVVLFELLQRLQLTQNDFAVDFPYRLLSLHATDAVLITNLALDRSSWCSDTLGFRYKGSGGD